MSEPAGVTRTFEALAHPARVQAVGLLHAGALRSGELASALSLSHPSTSRHLRVLRDAGLVDERPDPADARVRVYQLRKAPFTELRAWLDEVERFWSLELAAFKAYAERGGEREGPR